MPFGRIQRAGRELVVVDVASLLQAETSETFMAFTLVECHVFP